MNFPLQLKVMSYNQEFDRENCVNYVFRVLLGHDVNSAAFC